MPTKFGLAEIGLCAACSWFGSNSPLPPGSAEKNEVNADQPILAWLGWG